MKEMILAFHHEESGLETLEYIILATLVAAILTLSLVALFNAIVSKIKAINNSL